MLLFSALSSGTVMLTYVASGKPMAETVLRASNPDRFWQLVGLTGALPLLLGVAAVWFGWRQLRS